MVLFPRITVRDIASAIATGILLTLIFPPSNPDYLAWISFIPLLAAIEGKSPLQALWIGWLAGITHFASLLHWVTVAMTQYGALAVPTSLLLLILLSIYLGLYVGIFGAMVRFLRCHCLSEACVVAPLLWVLLEYARSHLFSGFPWCLLGYSQYRNLMMIQISDLVGVYGVGFIIMVVNISLYLITTWLTGRIKSFPISYTAFAISILVLAASYGHSRKTTIETIQADSPQLRVGIIQGNIDQNKKWEPSYLDETLRTYEKLSMDIAPAHPDLIIWPETAVPCYFVPGSVPSHILLDMAIRLDIPIAFGSLTYEERSGKRKEYEYNYYNSAFLVSPHQKTFQRYDKNHLVPFGEYVPLRSVLRFAHKLVVGIGDFSPGDQHPLFSLAQSIFGFLICYEIIFPEIAQRYGRAGAGFLVNITNDAWFGRTGAPYQHFSMAVFRAIENRISIVRSANSGISGIIEPTGAIRSQTPLFVRTYLVDSMPVNQMSTFYNKYGDIGVGLCALCTLFVLL